MLQKGFTIIELMIAIGVFSVAVVLISTGAVVISRQYEQSATKIKLEASNREIHQTITQAVQFTGGTPMTYVLNTDWDALCVGTQRFSFGKQSASYDLGGYTNLKAGLYADTVAENTCSDPALPGTLIGGGQGILNIVDRDNLLPANARVLRLSYDALTNTFTTKFVLSDPDLLNLGAVDTITCKSGVTGREYCAVVELQSSAIRRINN